MKAAFDTNVFVSAFIVPGSRSEDAFLLAQRRTVDLNSSVPILTEVARVLRTKFHQPEKDITAALKLISRAATIVRPGHTITALDDQPDNRILECAATAQVGVIVTGDQHLIKLRTFEGIAIVRVADFLRMIPSR
jgi:putative PIN family toxin of toxin-antitoxin system